MVQVKKIRMVGLLLVLVVAAVLPVCVAWGSYYCARHVTVPAKAVVPYNTVAKMQGGSDLPGFPSLLLCN